MSNNKYVSPQDRNDNLMKWAGFWRRNPHIFAKDFIGMQLFLYQKILLYMMNFSNTFMYIAARGAGKSFIIAVYCVIRCILYPGTLVVIASGTKKQAALIISEKIVALYNQFEAVRAEIGDIRNIKTGANENSVKFKNGSKISAVTSSDGSRGYRGNILILDEFRIIPKDIVEDVLKPFLNVMRQPPFLLKPEYRDYPKEQNKTIYISSAWYKSHWSWDSFKDVVNDMMQGKKAFATASSYALSIAEGLLDPEQAESDRSKYDQSKWSMEYEALFVGENDNSYFKLKEINANRTVTNAFIPPTHEEYIENQEKARPKNLSNTPRKDDSEIRIVALDVALKGGNKNVRNDSSAFTCMRLSPEKGRYRRDVMYLESIHRSISATDLAIRTKQLFIDFEADYVVLDAHGIGTAVLEALCSILHDEDRDIEYEPWSVKNNEDENERLKTSGAPVIIAYAADAKFNSSIAVNLKKSFEDNQIRLPIDDIEQREHLIDKGNFLSKDEYYQRRYLYPYVQATALMNELVSLEYTTRGSNIVVKEVGKTTKDRYSSIAYCNYYASELESDLLKDTEEDEYAEYLFIGNYK